MPDKWLTFEFEPLPADLNPAPGATAGDLDRLSLANAGYLSKTMGNLIECMDDMLAEQGKVSSEEEGLRGVFKRLRRNGHQLAAARHAAAGVPLKM
jgi:hypothetical protein